MADETIGGIPRDSKIGLKMTPPPSPNAPATNLPKKLRSSNFISTDFSGIISEGTLFIPPYFFLRYKFVFVESI